MSIRGIENRYHPKMYENIYHSLKKAREKDDEGKETVTIPNSDDKQGDSITISSQGWQAVIENIDMTEENVPDLTDLDGVIIENELDEDIEKLIPSLFRQQETVNNDSQEQKGKIGFNAAKRARQLAAAKNIGQVQSVIALLNQDLSECKVGVQNDMCDKEEVQKVLEMLQQAQKRMSEVSQADGEEEDQGFDAFAIASLM